MRLSREPRAERENGLDAREKQPVASLASGVDGRGSASSSLGLGRDPVPEMEISQWVKRVTIFGWVTWVTGHLLPSDPLTPDEITAQ